MTEDSTRLLIGNRYVLYEKIGSGGMGAVYRAMDRLARDDSTRMVALKRLAETSRLFGDTQSISDRLGLAREFRTLASLRHPNIISVLDYGFEPNAKGAPLPYFTMSLLENTQTIRAAAEPLSLDDKMRLVIQMLHALNYLHRRDVVHRDLKPANVLVDSSGVVKVLDFGLAVNRGHEQDAPGGTLAYMSPEALQGGSITFASDFYAVGVMIYELLTGRYPFDMASATRLLIDILQTRPDVAPLPQPLRPIVARLLEKSPHDRYQDALDLMNDLSTMLDMTLSGETVAIRESFLQAAEFVGREAEIKQLTDALHQVINARLGSAWLIGGESGVGKSRLLDELRTVALVTESNSGGVLVLRGNGVQGGGKPYQLWRDPLRRLALTTALSDLEAGILKPIIPDIESLLERPIPDAPAVDADLVRQRLILTIGEVFSRQTQPVLLLLEDLQWADESLEPLKVLVRLAAELPVLIVGSYRDDERPDLPDLLPAATRLPLTRFQAEAIDQLSYAMLGDAGRQPQVLDLLQRETEGNVFFLVEVVRALAEDAGSLRDIGTVTLPPSVFAEGIRSIVRHRLERVPGWGQSLLVLAAIAGRDLDLPLLRDLARGHLPEGVGVDRWLMACMNAAVFTANGERYLFAHDKLREGLLLEQADHAPLHRVIGESIERVYADHIDAHYNGLADHFYAAGDRPKTLRYARLAAENAVERYANREALRYLDRSLRELRNENDAERFSLLALREHVYNLLGERPAQSVDLTTLATLAEKLADAEKQAEVALRQAKFYDVTGDYPAALSAAERAIDHAHRAAAVAQEAAAMLQKAMIFFHQSEYPQSAIVAEAGLARARAAGSLKAQVEGLHLLGSLAYQKERDLPKGKAYYLEAREIAERADDLRGAARTLNSLGNVTSDMGDNDIARAYYEQALALYEKIGDRAGQSDVLLNLAVFLQQTSYYAQAIDTMRQAMALYKQVGNRTSYAVAMFNLGTALYLFGEYEQAHRLIHDSLTIREEIGDKRGAGITYINLCHLLHLMGNDAESLTTSERALQVAEELGIGFLTVYGKINKANALCGLGRYAESIALYTEVEAAWRQMEQTPLVMETLAGRADACLRENQLDQALACVEEIYLLLSSGEIDSAEEILKIRWVCYQVLHARDDPRAEPLLVESYQFLQKKVAEIDNDLLRDSYLNNVRLNRELRDAYLRAQDK